MPDYLQVLAVEPEVEGLPAGEDDFTYDSLRQLLEQHCEKWRRQKKQVRVLFTSPWEADSYGLFLALKGQVEEEFSHHSLEKDRLVEVSAETRPGLALTCDPGEFSDAFAAVSEGAEELNDRRLALPYEWKSVEGLLDLMRLVAPHLEASCCARVSIGGAPARLSVDPARGVTVEPLFLWLEDRAGRAMLQKLIEPVRPMAGAPIAPKGGAVHADALLERGDRLGVALGKAPQGKTPLTSGSAQARASKVWDASAAERLVAIEAPENQGERFEALRVQLMKSLLPPGQAPEAGALPLLLRRVAPEPPRVRAEIYSLLTRFSDPAAFRALATAFETDADNASSIAMLVWRQRGTVDLLVARLLSAWTDDPPLAKRIIAVLRDEYIEVSRAQLAGAPVALLTALGPVVKG